MLTKPARAEVLPTNYFATVILTETTAVAVFIPSRRSNSWMTLWKWKQNCSLKPQINNHGRLLSPVAIKKA